MVIQLCTIFKTVIVCKGIKKLSNQSADETNIYFNLISQTGLKRGYIEFGVVRIDSAIVVCIHSAICRLLLTRQVSYC